MNRRMPILFTVCLLLVSTLISFETARGQDTTTTETASITINRVGSNTSDGVPSFIELTDGGRGNTTLDLHWLVFFASAEPTVLVAYPLDGLSTDDDGLIAFGIDEEEYAAIRLADATLATGADAVGVYMSPDPELPAGAALSQDALIDFVVYGAETVEGATVAEATATDATATDATATPLAEPTAQPASTPVAEPATPTTPTTVAEAPLPDATVAPVAEPTTAAEAPVATVDVTSAPPAEVAASPTPALVEEEPAATPDATAVPLEEPIAQPTSDGIAGSTIPPTAQPTSDGIAGSTIPPTAQPTSVPDAGSTIPPTAQPTPAAVEEPSAAADSGLSDAATTAPAASDADLVHVVQARDSLSRLARRYSVTIAALAHANGLGAHSRLAAGQRITIPVVDTEVPCDRYYSAQARQTLTDVADELAIDADRLSAIVGYRPSDILAEGTDICLIDIYSGRSLAANGDDSSAEPITVHIVGRGDTLLRLSARYGVSVRQLMAANGIRNPNQIRLGTRLRIP